MSLNVEMPETSEETIAPQTRDMKLPQGLEEVLAFKSKWATQQVRLLFFGDVGIGFYQRIF